MASWPPFFPPGWDAVTAAYGGAQGTLVIQRCWLCTALAATLAALAARHMAPAWQCGGGKPQSQGKGWRGALDVGVWVALAAGCAGGVGSAAVMGLAARQPGALPVYAWLYAVVAGIAGLGVALPACVGRRVALEWGVPVGGLLLAAAGLGQSAGARLALATGSRAAAACDAVAAAGFVAGGLLSLGVYLGGCRRRAALQPAAALPQLASGDVARQPCARMASSLTFAALGPLFDTGESHQLVLDDVPPLPRDAATDPAAAAFLAALDDAGRRRGEARTRTAATDGAALRQVLTALYGRRWMMLGGLQAASVALSFSGPLCLNGLLQYLAAAPGTPAAAAWRGVAWSAAMAAGALAAGVVSTQFSAAALSVQTQLRAGVLAAVFRSMLRGRHAGARGALSAGRVTNFVSVDVQKLQDAVTSLHQLWSLPVQVGVTLYLLYLQVAFAFLAGLAVLAAIVPLNMVVSKRIGALTALMMASRDVRVARTGELLAGIRSVKMQAWEVPLLARIHVARSDEVRRLASRKYLDAVCVFLWAATPVLVALGTFATVVLALPTAGGHAALAPAAVFTTVSLLGLLIFPLNAFSWVVTGVLEAAVSLRRLDAFLAPPPPPPPAASPARLPEEATPSFVFPLSRGDDDAAADAVPSTHTPTPPPEPFVLHPQLPADTPRDTRLPLPLPLPSGSGGGTTLVLGAVGAGKSAYLRALLGDMAWHGNPDSVPAACPVSLAYAPQVPWVRGATLRQNIVCHAPWDPRRYARVLRATALDVDLAVLAAGDATAVTSSTLSGGQAARLGLARALYLRSTVLLADDVTAALDAAVGAAILRSVFGNGPPGTPAAAPTTLDAWAAFDAGVLGFLAADAAATGVPRPAIFATHDGRALAYATAAVVLVRGRIVYAGSIAGCPRVALEAAGMVPGGAGAPAALPAVAVPLTPPPSPPPATPPPPPPPLSRPAAAAEGGGGDGGVAEEARAAGRVAGSVVTRYARAAGWCLVATVALSLTAMQLSKNASDWFLSVWSAVDARSGASAPGEGALVADLAGWGDAALLTVFGCIAAGNTAATAVRSWSFAAAGLAAAVSVHDRLLAAVTAAPMAFHDAVPAGRLLNRLSADQYSTDETLPFQLNILLAQAFGLAGTILVLTYATSGAFALALPLLAVVYARLQRRYRATSREVKRLDSTTRSPLFSHLTDCLAGASVLRAHSAARAPHDAADTAERAALLTHLDPNQRTFMTAGLAAAWLSLRLQALGAGVLAAVCVFGVVLRWYTDGGAAACGDDAAPCAGPSGATGDAVAASAGLALAYGIPVVGALQGLLGAFTETEKEAVAVERAMEYIDTPAEGGGAGVDVSSVGVGSVGDGVGDGDVDGAGEGSYKQGWRPHRTLAATSTRAAVLATPLLSLNADPEGSSGGESGGACAIVAVPPTRGAAAVGRPLACTFHDVTVRYSRLARPAVSHVSFAVAAGERIGIAGRTGSGKSSLLAALWRLVTPAGGTITLDGIDIATLPLPVLRRRLAIVPQAPFLVQGSLRFNLDPHGVLSDATLAAALAAVALPAAARNLDAVVETGGANYSVGERQLLAVCRAVAQGAALIAVDEAAASADSATEARISDALLTAARTATLVIIAHRVSTLAACDRVLIMADGEVVESGTPAALAAAPDSHYAALLRAAAH